MLILILPFKFWQVLKVQDLACTNAILVHRILKVKVNGKDCKSPYCTALAQKQSSD